MTALWSDLLVRPMTADEAELIATWHYDGEWSVYDLASPQPLLDDLTSYYSVVGDEKLIGFCCNGSSARVPGMSDESAILDIGIGMDPTQVGCGHGSVFGQAVLNYLSANHPDRTLRAVVQDWNERSLRFVRRLGFVDAGELTVVQDDRRIAYRVVIKRPHRDSN